MKLIRQAIFRKHLSNSIGIAIMMFVYSLIFSTTVILWLNGTNHLNQEIDHNGFGDATIWVSYQDQKSLNIEKIRSNVEIENVTPQPIIFSNYHINDLASDSEGQIIKYEPQNIDYRIFNAQLTDYEAKAPLEISKGLVYVPASMKSMFDAEIGDEVTFQIARNSVDMNLIIAGFYEDPLMGSSMIGMKGFLVGSEDYIDLAGMIEEANYNGLARLGSMIHLKLNDDVPTTNRSNILNQISEKLNTDVKVEFSHTKETLIDFMLILQYAFSGFFLIFALILTLICLVMIGYSMSNSFEGDRTVLRVLKILGYTNKDIKISYFRHYLILVVIGSVLGILSSIIIAPVLVHETVTTTGILYPTTLPMIPTLFGQLLPILLIGLLIVLKTNELKQLKPLEEKGNDRTKKMNQKNQIGVKFKFWNLVKHQILISKRRYIGIAIASALLVFFSAMISDLSLWLGKDGEGMMTAFNPAPLDIAVQYFSEEGIEEVIKDIQNFTSINESYLLAMEEVRLNEVELTANIISQPSYFQIFYGRTIQNPNEIVVTSFVAQDLNLQVGDSVVVQGRKAEELFEVVGIYQCANDMGYNIGMERSGFLLIDEERPEIWCHHLFLEDHTEDTIDRIENYLSLKYGSNLHIHENSWPGLIGILTAMRFLIGIMYVSLIISIFIITGLTSNKIMQMEQREYGIYKILGFKDLWLRKLLMVKILFTSMMGGLTGWLLSIFYSSHLIAIVMRTAGISHYTGSEKKLSTVIVLVFTSLMFALFSFLYSNKITKQSPIEVIRIADN